MPTTLASAAWQRSASLARSHSLSLLSSRDAAVGASAAIECAVVHVVTRLDAQDDLDGECDDRQTVIDDEY